MGIYQGNLAPNSTTQTTSSVSNSYLHLYTYATFTLKSIAAIDVRTAAQIEADEPCYITVVISTSVGTSVQQRIDITNGGIKSYYTLNLSIGVPTDGWVLIGTTFTNAAMFYTNTQTLIPSGWTGSGTSPSSVGFFDAEFLIDYTDVWTIDDSNDGYPHISGINTIDWQGFEKDEDGYPKNWGVWKLDDQNDGYPWIVGYLPSHVIGGAIYKKVNGTLIPVQIYKKVNGNLIPII